ncbi:hypothetical protein HDE_08299 [Halotydeus destructor]|nr:hypothetical protein HDE_08299 [Halotydeus destructor]
MLAVSFPLTLFNGTVQIKGIVHHEPFPDKSFKYTIAVRRKVPNTRLAIYSYAVYYTFTDIHRLSAPYTTRCREYREDGYIHSDECLKRCVTEQSMKTFGKVPFAFMQMPDYNRKIVHIYDMRNSTFNAMYTKIEIGCEECYKIFDVKKFFRQEYICYKFEASKYNESVYDLIRVRAAVSHPNVLFTLVLPTSLFNETRDLKAIVHHEKFPGKSSNYAIPMKRKDKHGILQNNRYAVTFTFTNIYRLPAPFRTRCRNFTKDGYVHSDDCERRCVTGLTKKRFDKVPFAYMQMKKLDKKIIQQHDLRNVTLKAMYTQIERYCSDRCEQTDCYEHFTMTTLVAEPAAFDELRLYVHGPISLAYNIVYAPKLDIIDKASYVKQLPRFVNVSPESSNTLEDFVNMTLRDLHLYTPRKSTVIENCIFRYPSSHDINFLNKKQCYDIFNVEKIYRQEYVCYAFEAEEYRDRVYDVVSLRFSYAFPNMFFAVTFPISLFNGTHKIKAVVHQEPMPDKSSNYAIAMRRKGFLNTATANSYAVTYTFLDIRRMPPPYTTRCRDYRKDGFFHSDECLKVCVTGKSIEMFNKVPFAFMQLKEFKIRILQQSDLENGTFKKIYSDMEMECERTCGEPDCEEHFTMTMNSDKSIPGANLIEIGQLEDSVFFNRFIVSHYEIIYKSLPPPYTSMCRDYVAQGFTSARDCASACMNTRILEQLDRFWYAIPVSYLIDKHPVSAHDFENKTFGRRFERIYTDCQSICAQRDCAKTWTMTMVRSQRVATRRFTISVVTNNQPAFHVEEEAQLTFEAYLLFVMSCIGSWFGLSVLSFCPSRLIRVDQLKTRRRQLKVLIKPSQ